VKIKKNICRRILHTKSILFILALLPLLSHGSSVVTSGNDSVGLPNPPSNIDAGTWLYTGGLRTNTGYCMVGTRNGNQRRSFHWLFSDIGEAGNYYLAQNQFGDQVQFRMRYYRPSAATYRNLNAGAARRIDDGLLDCSGQGQSPFSLEVYVREQDLQGQAAGTYVANMDIYTTTNKNTFDPLSFDTMEVRFTIPKGIQVNQLDDITLGVYGGSGNMSADESFCVYTAGTSTYSLLVSDDSANSGFAMTHTLLPSEQLSYQLSYSNTTIAPTTFSVTENVSINTQTSDGIVNCGNGELATLSVFVAENDILALKAGVYQSIISLVVSAD
jgi:hypothetical protein